MKRIILIILCIAVIAPFALCSCGGGSEKVTQSDLPRLAKDFVENNKIAKRNFVSKLNDFGYYSVTQVRAVYETYEHAGRNDDGLWSGLCVGKLYGMNDGGSVVCTCSFRLVVQVPEDKPKQMTGNWYSGLELSDFS